MCNVFHILEQKAFVNDVCHGLYLRFTYIRSKARCCYVECHFRFLSNFDIPEVLKYGVLSFHSCISIIERSSLRLLVQCRLCCSDKVLAGNRASLSAHTAARVEGTD